MFSTSIARVLDAENGSAPSIVRIPGEAPGMICPLLLKVPAKVHVPVPLMMDEALLLKVFTAPLDRVPLLRAIVPVLVKTEVGKEGDMLRVPVLHWIVPPFVTVLAYNAMVPALMFMAEVLLKDVTAWKDVVELLVLVIVPLLMIVPFELPTPVLLFPLIVHVPLLVMMALFPKNSAPLCQSMEPPLVILA